MSSDDEYADESFSDESYLDDFEDSPPKTFRVGSQPTEKVVSDLSALDDLMASLDNTLEKAKEQGGPSTSGSSSAKKEVTSSKKGGDEDGECTNSTWPQGGESKTTVEIHIFSVL
jgi:hypothetical protein